MILSDKEILACLEDGKIIIEPFDLKYLNPNTVDLTLNPHCKTYVNEVLDCRKENPTEEFVIPEEGYVLIPGKVYLYSCNEKIGVPKKEWSGYGHICSEVAGKSSLGRLGLFVHVTAGFIDSGFVGSLVLELVCTQPIRIYPNMKICQVKFSKVYGDILESYGDKTGSKYMNQEGVVASKMHLNFEEPKQS